MLNKMRKLRVGVWVENGIMKETGGGHGYVNQLLKHLSTYKFESADIIFISYEPFDQDSIFYNKSYTIKWKKFISPTLKQWQRRLNKITGSFDFHYYKTDFSEEIIANNEALRNELKEIIDLIYYPSPGCAIPNFPFVYTLWDIGHLSTYAFPEVSMNGNFDSRKSLHDSILMQALAIFCESETGKKEAVKFLNINDSRIKVVPLFPSEVIKDEIDEQKPESVEEGTKFVHYPAQFWAHKNHYNLIIAFKEVIKALPYLKLILTGSDKGNKKYIISLVEEMELMDSVIDLGFVSTENLKWIYENSKGLVMPTFLGPTNMPLLEAAELGCPVACSDFEGHRELLGDYAIFFNPKDPKEIAQSIIQMVNEGKTGKKIEYISRFNIHNALKSIDESFSDLKTFRFCWGLNDFIR